MSNTTTTDLYRVRLFEERHGREEHHSDSGHAMSEAAAQRLAAGLMRERPNSRAIVVTEADAQLWQSLATPAKAEVVVRDLQSHIQQLRAALAASGEERERLAAERDALLEAVGRAVFPNLQDDGRKVYPWVKTALAEIADIGADVARLNWLEAAPKAVAHVQFGCALSAEITTLRAAIDFASSVSSSPPAGH